jgi:hypothetical protein
MIADKVSVHLRAFEVCKMVATPNRERVEHGSSRCRVSLTVESGSVPSLVRPFRHTLLSNIAQQ